MQTGYIYKFHNKITDKVYIGQTVRTLNERISEHSQETKEKLRLKAIEQWNKRKEESQKNKVLQYKIKGGK